MDPVSAGLLAGSTALSGALGYLSTNKALKQAELEAARQGAISKAQLELAEKINKQGLATQIDARGNITYYDEASNTWKVIPTYKQQALMDASDAEFMRTLNYDAPMARAEALRNSSRRVREGSVADGMLSGLQDQLAGKTGQRGDRLAAALRRSRTQAVNAGYDEVQRGISTQALRSGANGAGALAKLARARAETMAQTMGVPELEGLQAAEDLNATKMGNTINNYSALASRATNSGGVSYTPSNVAPTLNQTLQSLRSGAAGAGGAAGGMLANAGRPIQQPGAYNPAPTIAAGTSALSAILSSLRMGGGSEYLDNPYFSSVKNVNKPGAIDWDTLDLGGNF